MSKEITLSEREFGDGMEGSLDRSIQYLQDLRATIPQGCRSSAMCELDTEDRDWGSSGVIRVSYQSDAEPEARPNLSCPEGEDLIVDESGFPIGSAPKPKPKPKETEA